MLIERLILHHFRNYGEATIEFAPGGAYITGANGSGKTNLLEAMYYLANHDLFPYDTPGGAAGLGCHLLCRGCSGHRSWSATPERTRRPAFSQGATLVAEWQRNQGYAEVHGAFCGGGISSRDYAGD